MPDAYRRRLSRVEEDPGPFSGFVQSRLTASEEVHDWGSIPMSADTRIVALGGEQPDSTVLDTVV
jgi:hypothetical protein